MTTLTVATMNDDWGTKGTNYPDVAAVDVVLIQEGKRENYASLVDKKTHGVLQDRTSLATSGSVIIWAFLALTTQKTGLTFAVKAQGILARYLAWLRCTVGGRKMLFIAAHRPPKRAAKWWHPFNLALAARVRRAKVAGRLVIVGIDANHGSPKWMARMCGLKWHSVNADDIDGFLMSKRIKVTALKQLPKDTSDHHPLVATVEIPAPRKPKPPEPKPDLSYPAIAHCRNQSHNGPRFPGPNNGAGQCRLQARIALGMPSVGDVDGNGRATAVDAWKAAHHKHPGDRHPPRGFPPFWSGGSEGDGHEAISAGDVNGVCFIWSTDILRAGFWDFVPLSLIEEKWGLTYLGWASDDNGIPIDPHDNTTGA